MGTDIHLGEQITIMVAGIAVGLTCDIGVISGRLKRRYKNFLFDGSPELCVKLNIEDWDYDKNSQHVQTYFSHDHVNVYTGTSRGSIDLGAGSAQLNISVKQPESDVEYFLRVIYALLVFRSGGLMIHAAGLIHSDRALIFMGHSGKGKSTLIRLSGVDKILSDDLVIVKPTVYGWTAYATPFWNPGENTPTPYKGKLCGLYALHHGRTTKLEPLQRGQAVAELISNIPVIPDDPLRGENLISTCETLLNYVPTYQLVFSPDKSFLKLLQTEGQR